MFNSGRRGFMAQLGALTVLMLNPASLYPFFKTLDRKFRICLNPGALGVSLSQKSLLSSAIAHGFEAIVPLSSQLTKMKDEETDQLLSGMKQNNISWGCGGLPVQFRLSEEKFQQDMDQLEGHARALNKAGATSMSTWIMPTHADLTYLENFALHKKRLREVAKVLADHGIRLGLEYVGPKTLMARDKYAFIRTMKECHELLDSINAENVGLQLDAFHWYCAGESVEDILNLDPEQIVTVDLNDAKAGRTVDEQLDWERELPGTSGVIDIESFLKALMDIGYTGPVRAEPFNEELNKLENEAALKKTIEAMKDVVSKIE